MVKLHTRRIFGLNTTATGGGSGTAVIGPANMTRLSWVNNYLNAIEPIGSFVTGHCIASEREWLQYANMFKWFTIKKITWRWTPETTAPVQQQFFRNAADTQKSQNLELHMMFPTEPPIWQGTTVGFTALTDNVVDRSGLGVSALAMQQNRRLIKRSMNKRWHVSWRPKTVRAREDLVVVASTTANAYQKLNRGMQWSRLGWHGVVDSGPSWNAWDPEAVASQVGTSTSVTSAAMVLPLNEPYALLWDKNTQAYFQGDAETTLEVCGTWGLEVDWQFKGRAENTAQVIVNYSAANGGWQYNATAGERGGLV